MRDSRQSDGRLNNGQTAVGPAACAQFADAPVASAKQANDQFASTLEANIELANAPPTNGLSAHGHFEERMSPTPWGLMFSRSSVAPPVAPSVGSAAAPSVAPPVAPSVAPAAAPPVSPSDASAVPSAAAPTPNPSTDLSPSHPVTDVILVPGMVVSSSYMMPLALRLVPLCRVHTIDFPGYGKSEKPRHVLTLQELADSIAVWMRVNKINRAHLVANSFGCQVVVDLALRHPEIIDKIILQGPSVDPAARSVLRQFIRLKKNSWRESKSVGTISVRDYRAAGLKRVIKTIRMVLADDIEGKLPLVHAPALIVRGACDEVVPQPWAEKVAELMPNARLHVIPNAAHTLNYSEPDQFAQVIIDFLGLTVGSGSHLTNGSNGQAPSTSSQQGLL